MSVLAKIKRTICKYQGGEQKSVTVFQKNDFTNSSEFRKFQKNSEIVEIFRPVFLGQFRKNEK